MRHYFILFLFLFLGGYSLHAQQKFSLQGTIAGAKENSAVSLHFDNPANEPIAKGRIRKGKFVLKGTLEESAMYVLVAEGAKQPAGIFLDASQLKIKAHIDSLPLAKITGSAIQNEFRAFRSQFDPYFIRIDQLGKEINGAQSGIIRDSLMQVVRPIINELETKADAYIIKHKTSPVTPLLPYFLYSFFQQPEALERRFNDLAPVAQKSYYGKMVEKIINENKVGSVGSMAPDFSQADTSGNMIALKSFRGKYVLVDFWASWCGPCRMENPNVVEAYKKFKDNNFTVLGISLDRAKEPWMQAIYQDGLTWTHVSDLKFWSNEVARMFKISSIPQNFLLDPEGKIIAKNLRGEELQTRLKALFQKN